jgi:hypothetical protein
MSYEKIVEEIEQEIQNFNRDNAIELAQNPNLLKDPETFERESTYPKRRKETAKRIYGILLTAFENMEKNNQELEREVQGLKGRNEELINLVDHWKRKYQNKIFAND